MIPVVQAPLFHCPLFVKNSSSPVAPSTYMKAKMAGVRILPTKFNKSAPAYKNSFPLKRAFLCSLEKTAESVGVGQRMSDRIESSFGYCRLTPAFYTYGVFQDPGSILVRFQKSLSSRSGIASQDHCRPVACVIKAASVIRCRIQPRIPGFSSWHSTLPNRLS